MSDYSKLPSGERRVKSAKARLSPQVHVISATKEKLSKMSIERISSAKSIKNKQFSSAKAFADHPSTAAKGKERFTTMYSQDFDGMYAPPSEVRPTSPTRRNNPHPSKQFMAWKVPSREIGVVPCEEGLELPPEHITQSKNFDDTDCLLGGLKHLPTQATSTEYGAYLHRNLDSSQRGRPKRVGNTLLRRVVTDGNEDALADWLEAASPDEQHTVLKMLKSAEEEKIKQTILSVLKPEAAYAMHGWLKGADDTEKEVALRLFSSLGSSQKSQRMRSRSLGHLDIVRPHSREPVPPPFPPPPPRPSVSAVGSRQSTRVQQVRAPLKPHPVGTWHHKSIRDPPPKVYHRGSVFGGVRENASHFNIHPEWPDYYGDSRDPVH